MILILSIFLPLLPTIGVVYLKINKSSSNRCRCSFPNCNNRDNLHDISRKIRFKALKERKFYLPIGSRACDQHLCPGMWDTVDGITDQRTKFSTKQTEDMLQLLCGPSAKIVPEIPGYYSLIYISQF